MNEFENMKTTLYVYVNKLKDKIKLFVVVEQFIEVITITRNTYCNNKKITHT